MPCFTRLGLLGLLVGSTGQHGPRHRVAKSKCACTDPPPTLTLSRARPQLLRLLVMDLLCSRGCQKDSSISIKTSPSFSTLTVNLEQYHSRPNATVIPALRACLFEVLSNGTIRWENWNMTLALVCSKAFGNFREHLKYRNSFQKWGHQVLYIGRSTSSVPGDK
jgi:hypothetical protein